MKLVIKDNKVLAIHDNNQDIESLYEDCTILTDNSFTGEVGDDYTITDEQIKAIKIAELQAQIAILDLKSIRALREGGSTSDGTSYVDYYTSQIISLRNEIFNL